MGEAQHAAILEAFINGYKDNSIQIKPKIDLDQNKERRFILRK